MGERPVFKHQSGWFEKPFRQIWEGKRSCTFVFCQFCLFKMHLHMPLYTQCCRQMLKRSLLPTGFECQGGYKCSQPRFKMLWLGDTVFQYRGGKVHLPSWLHRAAWAEDICWKGKLRNSFSFIYTQLFPNLFTYMSKVWSSLSYILLLLFFRPQMIHSKKSLQRKKPRTKQVSANQVTSAVQQE